MNIQYEHEDKKLSRDKNKMSNRKVHSAEQTDLLKTLIKLKQQENVTERLANNFIKNLKVDSEIAQDVLHEQLQLATERKKYLDNLKRTVCEIVSDMKLVKSVITNSHRVQEIDVKVYKEKLLRLLRKMQDFKKSYSLQTLIEEQSKLEAELNEFTFDPHKCDVNNDTATKLFVPKGTSHGGNNENCVYRDYHEVQDFNGLIIRTGHTQNWSEQDHLFFLKMRKKCHNIPTLVSAIRNKCPDLSAECIVNHEAWYKIYLDLREKQRIAVKEWRKQRNLEKSKELERKDRDEEANVHKNNEKVDADVPKQKELYSIHEK